MLEVGDIGDPAAVFLAPEKIDVVVPHVSPSSSDIA